MPVHDNAANLFEYISKVYAIDLPVTCDVTGYEDVFWWQANLVPCSQCKIKEFDNGNNANEANEPMEAVVDDAWLSVSKRSYEDPPPLPSILRDWVATTSNPTRRPTPKRSIFRRVHFKDDPRRVAEFDKYLGAWKEWTKWSDGDQPPVPDILADWGARSQRADQIPEPIPV